MVKEYTKQVMHGTIAHQLLTDAQLVLKPWHPPANSPILYTMHDVIWYRISLWPVWV